MSARIGLIFNGVWSQYTMATAPKYRSLYELIYVRQLAETDLTSFDALVIPFQSNQAAIAKQKSVLYQFLAMGKKIAVFGDSSPLWLEANWEDRPVNNYWWVENPENPPIAETDFKHAVFAGLKPRHACWHVHGVYTLIPDQAKILQRTGSGEIITWQTEQYGGILFASTLDPIVEHGIQQIRHLDHFVDNLTAWLCGVKPEGAFTLPVENFGTERAAEYCRIR